MTMLMLAVVAVSPQKGNVGRYASEEQWRHLCGSQGDPPTLCPALPAPTSRDWSRSAMLAAVDEFVALYSRRPIDNNPGGMNANQGFSAWYTLRTLRPPVVVESGGARGQSASLIGSNP